MGDFGDFGTFGIGWCGGRRKVRVRMGGGGGKCEAEVSGRVITDLQLRSRKIRRL